VPFFGAMENFIVANSVSMSKKSTSLWKEDFEAGIRIKLRKVKLSLYLTKLHA
jgi:hypothetical protein